MPFRFRPTVLETVPVQEGDIKFIERFMLVFGPLSSVYDFITLYVLLYLFELR
jgi:hypothetical protein